MKQLLSKIMGNIVKVFTCDPFPVRTTLKTRTMKRTKKKEELKAELMKSKTFYELLRYFQIYEIDTNDRDFKDVLADYIIYNEAPDDVKVLGLDEEHYRICSECGKVMVEGYCIDNGMDYYCSDECLHKHMSQDEFDALYNDGRGDSYWTSWID